jgi:hypothetical protein
MVWAFFVCLRCFLCLFFAEFFVFFSCVRPGLFQRLRPTQCTTATGRRDAITLLGIIDHIGLIRARVPQGITAMKVSS